MEAQISQLRSALDLEKKTDDLQNMVGKDEHIEESTLINAIRKSQNIQISGSFKVWARTIEDC